ncbi:hypothetical protein JRQ81_018964 [Phrynocephalus forsythii]|uniref:Uncharacterized protein n=1 Tax=Phrynocephalus forsythii TaxID=171643 RepID=A0A9Q0XRY7_9SAUR|nr:hypothetical protein JRQ81_018964 [Phrynocephalus forsythii]
MMFSDLSLAAERLKSEKKFLSNMIVKLVGENQQLLRENKQFRDRIRSVQYPQQYMKRPSEKMEMDDENKVKKPQVTKHQQELCVSRLHDCHLAKHKECLKNPMAHHGTLRCGSTLTSVSTRCQHMSHAASRHYLEHELMSYPKPHLQCWERKMEEKRRDFFKEQRHMLEIRAALIEQEKHIQRLQTKINYLQDELKTSEIQNTLQVEELKKFHESWMCEIDVDHVQSQMNRTGKKHYVYIWQTSDNVKRSEEDTENAQKEHESLEKRGSQAIPKNDLAKGWLEASIEKLNKRDSEEAKKNVLGWLQKSLEKLKLKGAEASTQSLEEWLTESFNNLEKERSESSRQDVKEWLEVSISYLKEEGPDTSHMKVEEWLEASMKGIQDLQQQDPEASEMKVEANCEEVVLVPPCSRKYINKGWLEESLENLKARGSKSSRENVCSWLQESIKNLKKHTSDVSEKSLQEWLSESMKNLQNAGSETFKQDVNIWIETSIKNLQEEGPETSCLSVQGWLEESLKSLQEEASEQDVPELSRPSMKTLLQKGSEANVQECVEEGFTKSIPEGRPETPNQNLRQELEPTITKIEEGCPEASREDVKNLFADSVKSIKKRSPGLGLASVLNNKQEGPETYDQNVKEWLDDSIKSVKEAASRIQVQNWLEASLKTLEEAGSDLSEQNLEQWLETSMKNLSGTCSETYKPDVKKWLEEYLMNQQQQGLDASKTNVKEWLQASVHILREEGPKEPITDVQEWLEESIQRLKEEACRRNVEEWVSDSLEYLQKEDPGVLKEDVKKWLEESLANLHAICPESSRQDVNRWLETSLKSLHGVPREDLQEFLMTSMSNLRQKSLAEFRNNNIDWVKLPRHSGGPRDSLEKIATYPEEKYTLLHSIMPSDP